MDGRIIEGDIIGNQQHDARAFEGVRTRRMLAFALDYLIVGLLLIPFGIFVALLGLLTLGIAWSLFAVLAPLVAILYVWTTLGGPHQATSGMRLTGIRLERLDGKRIDGLTAVVHSVLFWAANVILSPLVLLVTLFSDRKRTLHDLLLGTIVVRA